MDASAMPDRIDRVTVTVTGDGDITLSWATRQALIDQLPNHANLAGIRARFDAAGATRPVALDRDQRIALRDMLGEWLMDDQEILEKQGLTDLYIALNRGEPSDYVVGAYERAGGFGSADWRWRWTHWRERRDPVDDHQHCVFCHTNIQDGAVEAAWCGLDEDDYERWVCAGCFDKLRERFGWTVDTSS